MNISYEFEGHKLTDWAEFGGLPVESDWPSKEWFACHDVRLIGIGPDDEAILIVVGELDVSYECGDLSLRYSKIEDVIADRPKWATHVGMDGLWLEWLSDDTWASEKHQRIKGHLFNPEDYPEPVRLDNADHK